ncbi:MAG: ABC transporter ATP-binding protein [Cohaesibacter sp.]|nr:ABC transporter ATP-binding protein [Cohaesibacter sp.]
MQNVVENGHWGSRGTAGATIAAGLTFDDITMQFGDKSALDGVSLQIEPGEIVSLLGQSGSGKTTLLRIAAGIERPTKGALLINDQVASDERTFVPPEKRSVGLMFQDYALFPHLSILQNVMFGLNDLPKQDAKEVAAFALKRVGLEDYMERFPHMLSGGQQQRVALARAIAPRPSVLLMDEPFSGLDNRLRDRVRDETLAVIREIGATCMIVTHDPEEALRMSDRIVLLRDGQIVQNGGPDDLYYRPADYWAARFFSELNEVEGHIRNGKAETPIGFFKAEGFEEGQSVRVCLRHHGLKLHREMSDDYVSGHPARILRRMFLGEVELYELALQGIDYPVFARIGGGKIFSRGDNIGVSFRKKHVLIFANGQ